LLKNIKNQTYHSIFSTLEAVRLLYEAGLQVPEMKISSADRFRCMYAIDMILQITSQKLALFTY
jgi:hypothetical protein